MECPKIRIELSAYLVGELPPEQAQRISAHLAGCAACRQALEVERQTAALLRQRFTAGHAHLAVPAAGWRRVETGLRGGVKSARPPLPTRRGRLALGGAALVLALLAALLFIPPVSARVGQLLNSWLRIDVPGSRTRLEIEGFSAFTPWAPTWLPAGFDLTTSGTHTAPGVDELSLTYANAKEQLLLVQRKEDSPTPLPAGLEMNWGTVQAVYADSATQVPAEISALFAGDSVRLIAWEQDGLRFTLYSNLEKEVMLRVAQSLQPAQR